MSEELMRCSSCGSWIRESAQFCEDCGAPTGAGDAATSEAVPPPVHLAERIRADRAALEGERKQVTILFADLADSMELAQRVDPEDWRSIIDRFFQLLADGVHEFEGTVDKFTGDGIMAIFGAPIAHEDHARRACLAALELQQQIADFGEELRRTHDLGFAIRIGLNSGEVVVGSIGDRGDMAYTAVGHTVGLAQRMEQAASLGGICLSPDTAALVQGYVQLGDPVSREVKGVGNVEVVELEGVGEAQGSIDVARARGLTPLIGREEELRTVESAFESSLSGRGQLVGVVGEPGVGKSRLCFEVAERCRARGIPVFHVAAQAHAKGIPLLPVLTLLRSYFEIADLNSDAEARDRVQAKLEWLGEGLADEAALLEDFLGIPDPDRPVERMDAEARQRRLLELVRRLIYAQSAREPSMTIFDDLQWIDPASEAFLLAYVEAAQGTRGTTLLSFRPDYTAPWMSRSYYRQIPLAPLHGQNHQELIDELLGTDPSVVPAAELISERAGGNPFFAEELVLSLAGSGHLEGDAGGYRLAAELSEAEVPATVQAVLAARIDRLPPERKATLEAAAVLGEEIPAGLLARVVELDDPALGEELGGLVAAEFLFERAPGPEPTYAFRHPLTQEVAYRSQLRDRRSRLHASAADAIAAHHPDQLDERAALIAHHWELAGDELEAARWFARAAAWSGTRDPAESVRSWRRVIELTDRLPESEETAGLGLAARVASVHLGWRLGMSIDKAERLFKEAERMAIKSGDLRLRILLLGGYGAVLGLGQRRIDEYAQLARDALALAEEADDPTLSMPPNAWAFFLTGDLQEGLAALDRAIEAAGGDPTFGAGVVFACPYALCLAHKGAFLTMLGELDRARAVLQEGRAIAREYGDPENLGSNHGFATLLEYVAGNTDAALEHGRQAVQLAERTGGALWRAWAWTDLGLAQKLAGESDLAIESLERAEEISEQGRSGIEGRVLRQSHLAEALLATGDSKRAHDLAGRATRAAAAQGGFVAVIPAGLAMARVLLADREQLEGERIERELGTVLEMVQRTGARGYEPQVRVELARLARRLEDEERAERELNEARRLFGAIGAHGRLARLDASELDGASGIERSVPG
jgi:class 3 adenylate cyclase/tetratricopeptide (TPR) repeat protein